MDFFGPTRSGTSFSQILDLRQEIHKVLYGSIDVPAQGQLVILREFNDQTCPACWDETQGGTRFPACKYCQGEGYQFTERVVTAAVFAGVAPVYKPSILGTGQYPIAAYGDTDPNRDTGFVEWLIYPNYERYTYPSNKTPDKMYQIKVDGNGRPMFSPQDGQPIRSAKWNILAVTPLRGDQGRVEYFELGLIKDNLT